MSTPPKDESVKDRESGKHGEAAAADQQAAGQGGSAARVDATIDDDDMHGALPASREHDDEEEDQDEDEIPYPEPEDDAPLVPPVDFRPFFTLIEDSSGEHHHPNVHYVFADDDPDILTTAALETLGASSQGQESDVEERFVILDLASDGKRVLSSTSLSPNWQAIQTKVSPAPSWGGGEDGKTADKRLMLTVTGKEAPQWGTKKDLRRKGDINEMMRSFDEQIGSLDRVLDVIYTPAVPDAA